MALIGLPVAGETFNVPGKDGQKLIKRKDLVDTHNELQMTGHIITDIRITHFRKCVSLHLNFYGLSGES